MIWKLTTHPGPSVENRVIHKKLENYASSILGYRAIFILVMVYGKPELRINLKSSFEVVMTCSD